MIRPREKNNFLAGPCKVSRENIVFFFILIYNIVICKNGENFRSCEVFIIYFLFLFIPHFYVDVFILFFHFCLNNNNNNYSIYCFTLKIVEETFFFSKPLYFFGTIILLRVVNISDICQKICMLN